MRVARACSRATVYRRWPNLDALLVHLLRGLVHDFGVPPHDDVRDALVELLAEQADVLIREAGTLYPILGHTPRSTPRRARRSQRSSAGAALLWKRSCGAASRRSTPGRRRHRSVPVWLRAGYYRYLGALAGQEPIEREFIARVVDNVLGGLQHGDRTTDRLSRLQCA